ncbi:phosphotransferase family protein [Deinococcus puniceus]|uniref:Aminoglycoside phosphotransferase n=1 Tax=Deinococcus puniceus TaxID=1182568 RepID=A0A172TDC9_9DEIO|nr:phosphotransferase [Deinococcus puniceus]ANE44917.1 aminoglycoside phosphotransferase [Deinococcus puniceus]
MDWLNRWREAQNLEAPAVVPRLPPGVRAAFPGALRCLEAWTGEGAGFARYASAHGPLFLKYLPAAAQQPRPYHRLAREIAYLRDLAPLSPVPHAPLLHAAQDSATHRAHLITADLTDSTLGWGAFASDEAREGALLDIVRLLALHHAFWWNRPEVTAPTAQAEWTWNPARAVRQAQEIARFSGAAVQDAARQLPELLAATSGVTLAHGDIHSGQVLWPEGGGPPILIDYGQTQTAPLGVDFAHLLALRLNAAERLRLGPSLRATYLAELARHGLTLSTQQFAHEERAGLALNLLSTARQAVRTTDRESGVGEALERAAAAWQAG